jgi:hypothetical protein
MNPVPTTATPISCMVVLLRSWQIPAYVRRETVSRVARWHGLAGKLVAL